MWSMAFALPISLRSQVNYGKFYDPGNSGGKVYQYETGVRAGRHLVLSTGVIFEYYKCEEFPSYFGIPEYRIVSEEMHQYAYGGTITAGFGQKVGLHLTYRFKRVRTYGKKISEDFINAPGIYLTEAGFKEEPAYDVVLGMHYKIPKTNILVTGDWTFVSKIWNTDRIMITFGIGYEFNVGNIGKAN